MKKLLKAALSRDERCASSLRLESLTDIVSAPDSCLLVTMIGDSAKCKACKSPQVCVCRRDHFQSTNNSKRRVSTMLFWKNKLGLKFPVADAMLTRQVWGALQSCDYGIKVGNGQRKVPNGPVCVNPFCYSPAKPLQIMKPMLDTFELLGLLTDSFIQQILVQMGWNPELREFEPLAEPVTEEFLLKGFELIAARVRQVNFQPMYDEVLAAEHGTTGHRTRSLSPPVDDHGYASTGSGSTPPHAGQLMSTELPPEYSGEWHDGVEQEEWTDVNQQAIDSLESLLQEDDIHTDLIDWSPSLSELFESSGSGADFGGVADEDEIVSGLLLPESYAGLSFSPDLEPHHIMTMTTEDSPADYVLFGEVSAMHGDSMVMKSKGDASLSGADDDSTLPVPLKDAGETSHITTIDSRVANRFGAGDVVAVFCDGEGQPQVQALNIASQSRVCAIGVMTVGVGKNAQQSMVCMTGIVKVNVKGIAAPGQTIYVDLDTCVATTTADEGNKTLTLGRVLESSPPGASPDSVNSIRALITVKSTHRHLSQEACRRLAEKAHREMVRASGDSCTTSSFSKR